MINWHNREIEIDGSQRCIDCGEAFVHGQPVQPYKHWVSDMYIFRCLPCDERRQRVEDYLDNAGLHGRKPNQQMAMI